MTKEDLNNIENPPVGWYLTDKITPCGGLSIKKGAIDGEVCGKITEYMYPIYGGFFCEEHRGTMMGIPLCCTHCFEPYWLNFPERCMGDKWTGHCGGAAGCCHARDRRKQAELEATPEYQKQRAEELEKRRQYNFEHADEIRDEYVVGRCDFSDDGGYAGQNVVYGKVDGSDNHTAHDGAGYLEPLTLAGAKEAVERTRYGGSSFRIYKLVEVKVEK